MSDLENESSSSLKYLFLIETKPLKGGCCGCTLKQATIFLIALNFIFAIYNLARSPSVLYGQMAILIILKILIIFRLISLISLFIGTIKNNFRTCYKSYIVITIFDYIDLIIIICYDIFLYEKVSHKFYLLIIIIFLISLVTLLYVNFIYFSFTKKLGIKNVIHVDGFRMMDSPNEQYQIQMESQTRTTPITSTHQNNTQVYDINKF